MTDSTIEEILDKQRQYFVDKYDSIDSPYKLSNEQYWEILKDIETINATSAQAITTKGEHSA